MSDRTVHGHTFDGREIVRYDRSGKWWIESPQARRCVSLRVAVNEALWNGNRAILGKPGGRRFDALVIASSTHRSCSADAERNEPNTPEEGR